MKNKLKVKILVAYHKYADFISNDIYIPVNVGRSLLNAKTDDDYDWLVNNMIGDNTGDNISDLNDEYCELTAIYWAWKNPEKLGNPDYVGLNHYRRLLNFSQKITNSLSDLDISTQQLTKVIKGFDIIVPQKLGAFSKNKNQFISTVREHWNIEHSEKDLDFIYNRVIKLYPEYKEAFDNVLSSSEMYWYNMSVMRFDLFKIYARWMFNILDFDSSCREKPERLKGYFAEILLSVFVEYHKCSSRVKEVPVLRHQTKMEIPIALATDKNYIPYCKTLMLSVTENLSPDSKAHFYIIHNGLSFNERQTLKVQNAGITWLDIDSSILDMFNDIEIPSYISKMSFARLLLPELLPEVDKIIYLDIDTLVIDDITKLYNIGLGENYLGGVEDVNKTLLAQILNIEDDKYINAGVLLMNLKNLRGLNIKNLLSEANFEKYELGDQDLINDVFRNKIQILSPRWNMHHSFHFHLPKFIPDDFEDFNDSCLNPSIIHFVGRNKPWQENSTNPYTGLYLKYYNMTGYKNETSGKYGKKKKLLENIFSIGNIYENFNVHKCITVLGLKFKFKDKTKILKRCSDNLEDRTSQLFWRTDMLENRVGNLERKDDLSACIETIWRTYGATPELMDKLSFYSQSSHMWNTVNRNIWLIYISCLLEHNNFAAAEKILAKYIKKHKYKDLDRYLPAAAFVYDIGVKTYLVQRSHKIFKELQKNNNDNFLAGYFKGKTVAIVGNGPSETGKNKGAEIDSHDIVVRFNNYNVSDYVQDYGEKTTVWIKCSSDDIVHTVKNKELEVIIYEPDYMHHPLIDGYARAMYDEISKYKVFYFDFNDHIKLRNELDIFPSTGLVAIEKIFKFDCKRIDLYGFGFLQEKPDKYATHYFCDRPDNDAIARSSHHSFDVESEYLKNKFSKKQTVQLMK